MAVVVIVRADENRYGMHIVRGVEGAEWYETKKTSAETADVKQVERGWLEQNSRKHMIII